MKYLLFAGPTYYAGGGITDYVGRYETVDEAKVAFQGRDDCNDWAHIVEAETMEPVAWYTNGMFRGQTAGWKEHR